MRGNETVRVEPRGPLVATTSALEAEAAALGVGVIRTFEGFLAPALADGRLEEALEDWSERFPGPFLYFAGRRHLPPPLRAFVDFLKATAGPAEQRA